MPITMIYRFCKKLIYAKEMIENSQEDEVGKISEFSMHTIQKFLTPWQGMFAIQMNGDYLGTFWCSCAWKCKQIFPLMTMDGKSSRAKILCM